MNDVLYTFSADLTKGELRQKLRAERAALPDMPGLSLAAQRHILEDPLWQAARIVALYAPTRHEPDTSLLHAMAVLTGKQVWLPRCVSCAPQAVSPAVQGEHAAPAEELEFACCLSPSLLTPGRYGIMEPDPRRCPAQPDDLAPDLALVPGLAFDRQGFRLGYGGGYYDRLLARPIWAGVHLLGLCPAALMCEALPHDPWDVPVHGMATEEGITWL